MSMWRCLCHCLVGAAFGGSAVLACMPSAGSYFNVPSYIDPDYRTPLCSEIRYNRRLNFGVILHQYAKFESGPRGSQDSSARETSARNEPKSYFEYQKGAEYFRAEQYDSALAAFTRLRSTADSGATSPGRSSSEAGYSWVREASSYMIARCQLIIAQNSWDGYSDPIRAVDQGMLLFANSNFRQYLQEYPNGIYASSASHINRKIYFLSGRQELLDEELKRVMLELFPASGTVLPDRLVDMGVVEEFQDRFHGQVDFAYDSPILMAYAWLGSEQPKPQDLTVLELREQVFSAYPGLFRFVRAQGLYRLGRFQELLEKTVEEPPVKSGLWLSTQLLRVRSMEKTGDSSSALAALEKMHAVSPEDQIDVEIASLKLNTGDGLWLFSEESPVSKEWNLRAFALSGLSDRELEAGIDRSDIPGHNRQILADELARRYVLSGRFKELSRLLDSVQVDILMPVKVAIAALAANPRDVRALVDVGELLNAKSIGPKSYFDGLGTVRWVCPPFFDLPQCEPCRSVDERVANYTPPMWFFLSAVKIARSSGEKSEAEAKALHYIVIGGRSGPWMDRCTWNWSKYTDSSFATSKRAFARLHHIYKDSPWAAATPYYYR
jgi:hypothetical protein